MAQAVVPAMQCRVGAKAAAGRVWSAGRTRTGRGGASPGFKVMAVSTGSTGVVPRLEQLLNMDTTPYTDKVIAEYIWYVPSTVVRSAENSSFFFLFLPHARTPPEEQGVLGQDNKATENCDLVA